MATLEPLPIFALVTACQAVGKMSVRNNTFSSDKEPGTLKGPTLPLGIRTYSAWPPGTPPYKWLYPNSAAPGGICFLFKIAPRPVLVFSQAAVKSCSQKKQ